jgi:general secretion pathway protein I
MKSDRRESGFTLLEVLVALAIVGLALGAVASVFSLGLTAHATTSAAATALAVAEEQLTLAAATPHPGTTHGIFANNFAWQTTVGPYRDADAKIGDTSPSLPRLYRIAVAVAWRDGRHARQVSLSTLRLAGPSP